VSQVLKTQGGAWLEYGVVARVGAGKQHS